MIDDSSMSKAELLDAIQRGWEAFYAYLDTLSDAQLTQLTDAVGWTVKDHVAHVVVWEDAMIALLEQRPLAAALGVDAALLDADDSEAIDASNAILKARDQALTWPEVRQKHEQIHQRLIEHIQALTDADLLRPYRDYAPESRKQANVLAHLVSNTSGHYDEHRRWIEAIVSGEAQPMSKAQLLDAMQRGWNDLNAYLDTLSEAQVTQPTDAGGWTAKDHVIHLAVWEGSMNAFLQKLPRWEYIGVDRATWEHDRPDGVNAVIQQRNQDLSWAQVRQQFQQAHQELIGRVQTLSDEDLRRPYSDYQPGSEQTDTAAHRLGVASYDHYAEHIPWIEAIVQGEK